MTEKTKNYLGWALIIGVLALGYGAISAANSFARASEPASYRSFAVSGDGKVVAVPDVAEFNFSVITEGGTDIAKLQTDNTAKVNKAVAFMKQNGIADKDIKTESYQLEPRYQNTVCNSGPYYGGSTVCPPPAIVGYTIRQTVTVKARDFSKLGSLLSGAVSAGANSVSQLNFTVDDRTALENQAREEAISKAKAKAKAIAKAGGFSLGRLLTINENGMYPMYKERLTMSAQDMAYGMGGAAAPAPSIEPGSQEIVVNVNLEYEIK